MSHDAERLEAFDQVLGPGSDLPIGRLGGLTRRQMLRFCAGVAATMGLSQAAGVRMALAAESPLRPPVIWLHGQECTGCTETLLRAYHPTLESLLLDVISLDYHDTLCVGAGKQALDHKHKVMEEFRGKYILVTEGGTPMADGGIYCKVGGRTQVELVREAAQGAAAVIAIGSCASWGGVQSAHPNPTGAVGTHEVIPDKTVINVPGCPPNPYNFLSTVLHILTFGEPPALDELQRPRFAYGRLIHENCERRPHFDAGRFALEFGDAGHRQGFCLYKIGCKGPETHANWLSGLIESTLTLERLYAVKALIDELGDFVHNAMMADVAAVGALYADWTGYGKGIAHYLSVPDLPLDEMGTQFELPGGYIPGGDMDKFRAIGDYQDAFFRDGVKEEVGHSWCRYAGDQPSLHPWDGQTEPGYTDFQDDGKYSWIKAPTFHGERVQVGPLANVLAMAAAGHESTQRHLDKLLAQASAVAGAQIPVSALHSTIGRIAARAVRCAVLHDSLVNQWNLLMANIARRDFDTWNRPVFPKGEIRGFGFHEAPRGVLSHWVVIEDAKIRNYQAVVPSTWNAGPRDDRGRPGPYEAALLDNPVADPELPLEVLRTVHSFDPCIACAIHMSDPQRRPIVSVKAF